MAVAAQGAKNLRWRLGEHTVDHRAGGVGLGKVGGIALGDRECLPVDGRVALPCPILGGDRQLVAHSGHLGRANDGNAASRVGID